MIAILAAAGGYAYYSKDFLTTRTTNGTALQTERVRRGDLVVSASGSGTLIAQTDASFGFDSSGQVTDVYVKVGDQVEKGQVLAQVDGTLAQMDYAEAEQALLELYSAASLATVQQEIGTAQDAEYQAREWLKYLISPQVEEAEENLALTQQKLAEAQAGAKTRPSEAANQAVKEKEQAIAFLQDKLIQAQEYYENYYLPEKFGTWENVGSRRHPKMALVTYIDPKTGKEVPEINGPSIDDIATARNNLAQALETIQEDEIYLQVLQTGVIPEGATGEKLTTLYNAQQAVEDAKAGLKAKQLIAPISGTITSLNLSVGEQVEKATSSNTSATSATVTLFDVGAGQQTDTSTASIVTISQLDQPYTLDIYLEEADWSKAKVGNKVNVTFKLLPEQTFPGTVTLVYPVLNESFDSSLVHILVQLDQRISQDLPAGTGVTVEVVGGEAKGAVLVPVKALQKTKNGKYIVAVLQNGKQVERQVEIGLQNDTYAEVKSGLEAGEIVVTK